MPEILRGSPAAAGEQDAEDACGREGAAQGTEPLPSAEARSARQGTHQHPRAAPTHAPLPPPEALLPLPENELDPGGDNDDDCALIVRVPKPDGSEMQHGKGTCRCIELGNNRSAHSA